VTPALIVERSAAGPRPDDRQRLLISLVQERNAAGTTRQLEAWVHRRGLASLQAFRRGAVPELLSAADDAWLEGCLHEPLEQRLLQLDAMAPGPQAPAAAAAATPGPACTAAAAPDPVTPDPSAPAVADGAATTEAVARAAVVAEAIAAEMGAAHAVGRASAAIGLAVPAQQELAVGHEWVLEQEALEPEPLAQPWLGRVAVGMVAEGYQLGPNTAHGVDDDDCAEPPARLALEVPAAPDLAVPDLAAPDLAASALAASDLAGSNLAGSDVAGSDLAGSEHGVGFGGIPTGQGSVLTPPNQRNKVADNEPPLPLPSPVRAQAAALESFGLEALAGPGRPHQDLPEPLANTEFNAPLFAAGGEGAWSLPVELAERQEPDNPATLSPLEAIASAPSTPAPGAEAGGAPQLHEREQTTNLPTTAEPSRHEGLEGGLSTAGPVLADAPQRLRRKLFASLGKAKLLVRACLEEAISTLQPHGDVDQEEEQAPPSAATLAAGGPAAPERLGASWPGGDSPLEVAAQPASDSDAAPNPHGANPHGAAPLAAWSRSRGNSLPGSNSLAVPLQGPPAPAPAHLADLRAWLPGSSDQDRRAS
jgi:hypothetical protein